MAPRNWRHSLEPLRDLGSKRLAADPELLEHRRDRTLGIAEQCCEQMFDSQFGVSTFAREALSAFESFLRLDRETFEIHGRMTSIAGLREANTAENSPAHGGAASEVERGAWGEGGAGSEAR